MDPTKDQIATVLRKALALMNDGGKHWVKDSFHTWIPGRGHCYCSVGAINEVMSECGLRSRERYALREAVLFELAHGLQGGAEGWFSEPDHQARVTAWNDHPRRTWKDVVARFEKTIARVLA